MAFQLLFKMQVKCKTMGLNYKSTTKIVSEILGTASPPTARISTTRSKNGRAMSHRSMERFISTSRAGQSVHFMVMRSEEHTSELQSRENLVCRLLLE